MERKAEERMGRATALGILARMAQDRDATLDEVRALQVACRNVAKRLFDSERHFKRRRAEQPPELKSSEVEKLKSNLSTPQPFNLSTPADEGGAA